MKQRIISFVAVLALLGALSARSFAAIPWAAGAGTGAPLQQTSTTPTCTYTATALACISLMTGNTSALTLAGMTAGTYYSIIFVQDGTGTRTLTQSSITAATGGPAVPAITTAVNSYSVWVIKATSASAATFVANYDNAPLWDTWTNGAGIAGTGVAVAGTTTVAAIPSVVIPGMTASDVCFCTEQAVVGVNTALTTQCSPNTNYVQCNWKNASAASVTATAATFNVRILP